LTRIDADYDMVRWGGQLFNQYRDGVVFAELTRRISELVTH
jgi:hypothetical protein